ncbi:MAG: glycosyltransferase [Syntrophobacteraceae bacterium]|nr:glycosyltransferase [Desulfobacteraceae bacterium]
MRVLLSNPPWFPDDGRRWGIRAGSRWPFTTQVGADYYPYPFLLGYATSTLLRNGIETWMVDSILTRESIESYFERLRYACFDYVVIETSTPSIDWDLRLAGEIHSRGLGKVILAGPHATVFADDLIALPHVHAVLKGAYELNVLDAVTEGGGRIYDYKLAEDIDTLPFPYRDTATYRYSDRFPVTPCGPMLQMWGSRGCPHRCVFCLWPPVMYRNRYCPRKPASILAELHAVLDRLPRFTSVYFDDDTFNVGNERMLELCKGMKEIGLPWSAMCRADTVSIEAFEQMRDSGCYAVKLGVESGCQELVDRCNKKLDLKTVENVTAALKRMGIFVHLTFTFGLPGETVDTIRRTRAFFRRVQPDTAQESFCTPFPGTPFYDFLKKSENLEINDWAQFDGARTSIVSDAGIGSEALCEMGKLHSTLFVFGHQLEQHMGPWLIRAAAELGFVPVGVDCFTPSTEVLERLLKASPLDIFLADRGVNLTPQILSMIRARKILYYPEILPHIGETNEHAEKRYREFQSMAPFFDCIVLHDASALPLLIQRGHRNIAGHVVFPFEPRLHRPLNLPREYDISFIGLASPYRNEWLDLIRTRFPVHTPHIYGDAFVEEVNKSRIVLNLHHTPLPNTEHRVIKAMACGAFVLSEPLSQPELFEDGKEIVLFNRDNLLDLIAYYLEHEEEREAIAAAGHARVWNRYTATRQLGEILRLSGEPMD